MNIVITSLVSFFIVLSSGIAQANEQTPNHCLHDDAACIQEEYQHISNNELPGNVTFAFNDYAFFSTDTYGKPRTYKKYYYGGPTGNPSNRSWFRNPSFSTYFSSAPQQGPAHPKGTVVFDPKRLNWAAYGSDGSLVKSGKASGGAGYCPDIHRSCHTPVGGFAVYSKGGPGCKSKKYPLPRGGAPMPNCMYFHGGYSIHGSYEIPNFNASHGCIRVQPSAAAWLNQNFVQHGTRVVVRPYY